MMIKNYHYNDNNINYEKNYNIINEYNDNNHDDNNKNIKITKIILGDYLIVFHIAWERVTTPP